MLGLIFANAYAQTAAPAAEAPSAFMSMAPLIMVFAIFYILMLRPQQKRAQKQRDYLKSLEKGSEVYTNSGIIGKITAISEKVVTLELEGGTKIKILRSHIGGAVDEVLGNKTQPKKA
ncbi:MAG: preprotein translocase subunit YajC [Halobacteriovoraceae bacterium]|nr:preprotein translocase subunit YajC [Halobacteriovoraceae bacterium]|tara:strand:+ start:1756 stop:2109 length:354 start_codon:yes stop_codon:yes gene_type:complete